MPRLGCNGYNHIAEQINGCMRAHCSIAPHKVSTIKLFFKRSIKERKLIRSTAKFVLLFDHCSGTSAVKNVDEFVATSPQEQIGALLFRAEPLGQTWNC